MTEARQVALADLCFNMGLGVRGRVGLLSFTNTLSAMERGDWPSVVAGLQASDWARKVGPSRANPLERIFLTGVF
jgi:GH24 family phage-related lysozyme (muramidase)